MIEGVCVVNSGDSLEELFPELLEKRAFLMRSSKAFLRGLFPSLNRSKTTTEPP